MKKIIKNLSLVLVIMVLCLVNVSCGGGTTNKAKRGWEVYLEIGAKDAGVSVSKYREILEKNLSLSYVYLEQFDTYYYKGTYTTSSGRTSSFYFTYLVDEDFSSDTSAKTYEYALDLYLGGDKGERGYL
ncbi:MAG: hypothetical protein E7183_05015 [Erysipelotrichaceae bacterium]|nr:hypothetical protein [Erysipelotrichaceae bacterium]